MFRLRWHVYQIRKTEVVGQMKVLGLEIARASRDRNDKGGTLQKDTKDRVWWVVKDKKRQPPMCVQDKRWNMYISVCDC